MRSRSFPTTPPHSPAQPSALPRARSWGLRAPSPIPLVRAGGRALFALRARRSLPSRAATSRAAYATTSIFYTPPPPQSTELAEKSNFRDNHFPSKLQRKINDGTIRAYLPQVSARRPPARAPCRPLRSRRSWSGGPGPRGRGTPSFRTVWTRDKGRVRDAGGARPAPRLADVDDATPAQRLTRRGPRPRPRPDPSA